MKITAIICEYNPMTYGHVRHIEAARKETDADTILCVMSGSFVQRGDAAIADKYLRADAACRMGADIVVELPTIYAISPADNFAYGAIKTISAFPNVEYISFGSEAGDVELLRLAAELLFDEPQDFKDLLQTELKAGYSFPKARALALNSYAEVHPEYEGIKNILDNPNNVLGVSYMIAAKKAGLDVKFHTVKRESDYNSDDIDAPSPSATAVRVAVRRGELSRIKDAVPPIVFDYLSILKPNGTSLGDMELFKVKSMSGFDLENYYDVSGGIHNRLKIAATDATTVEEMLEKAKTKKYTMARLKRLCLYALFDITQATYENAVACPPYVQILALKKSRKDVLSALSASCPNVLTRYSDVNLVDKSLRFMIKLDFAAQGTLDIINRMNYYNKKMILVDDCNLK